MSEWKYFTPERDGHAPDDWVEGSERQGNRGLDNWFTIGHADLNWYQDYQYRYRPLQDAKPDLLAQCLALPQDQREALIEAMQKPQRDWADDIATKAVAAWTENGGVFEEEVAAVIRSICRTKENDALADALRPFVDLKHQKGAWDIIHKSVSDFEPVTLTVTKQQMLALLASIEKLS